MLLLLAVRMRTASAEAAWLRRSGVAHVGQSHTVLLPDASLVQSYMADSCRRSVRSCGTQLALVLKLSIMVCARQTVRHRRNWQRPVVQGPLQPQRASMLSAVSSLHPEGQAPQQYPRGPRSCLA